MLNPHSKTYTEFKPENIIHKTRLNRLLGLLHALSLPEKGSWADFGCSDGFILEHVRSQVVSKEWQLFGYDFVDELLELARQREIQETYFHKFDLNTVLPEPLKVHDVVTCFETMEHVGNYKNAVDNLVNHTMPNGWLIISVPNETGLPGLLKYFGRLILRKNPYDDFFKGKSQQPYLGALMAGKDIEQFRDPNAKEWSQHLGFNYKNLFLYIENTYIKSATLTLMKKESSFIGFNKIFVFRKAK